MWEGSGESCRERGEHEESGRSESSRGEGEEEVEGG